MSCHLSQITKENYISLFALGNEKDHIYVPLIHLNINICGNITTNKFGQLWNDLDSADVTLAIVD